MRAGFRFLVMAMALVLAVLPAQAERLMLNGEVTYRERIALPEGASLSIALIDLANPTTPQLSARGAIASPGQVPLKFALGFDDSLLLAGASYGLIAEIVGGDGAVWFRSATPYPVDPRAPAEDILLLVSFAGTTTSPSAPAPQPAAPAVLGTNWVAETISGNPVAPGIQSTLSIAADMRAGGRGGCNSWFAQADLGDGTLVFSAVAATRMACLNNDAMMQEDTWFTALAATRLYRLEANRLVLLDEARGELAVLVPATY